jgi:hypothetical protein
MLRTRRRNSNRLGKRRRCDALLRRPWTKGPDGRFRLRNPRCQAWAMPNGRCRFHGGLSTGPRSPEGKARVVAAMVAGHRAWVERVRAEGKNFTSGRKTGPAWVTERMSERACEEARKLTGGWCPPFGPSDRKLVLALLRSANGSLKAREQAKELLRGVAMRRAASSSPCYLGLIAMASRGFASVGRSGAGSAPKGSHKAVDPASRVWRDFAPRIKAELNGRAARLGKDFRHRWYTPMRRREGLGRVHARPTPTIRISFVLVPQFLFCSTGGNSHRGCEPRFGHYRSSRF